MLRASRRLCALLVAANCQLVTRWIPSEWNPADHVSRLWEPQRIASRSESKEFQKALKSQVDNMCYPNAKRPVQCRGPQVVASSHANEEISKYSSSAGWKKLPRASSQTSEVPSSSPTNSPLPRSDVSGGDGSQPRGGPGLCEQDFSLFPVCSQNATATESYQQVGQQLLCLSESAVRRRHGRVRRVQNFCRSDGLPSRPWLQSRFAKSSTESPGVVKGRPRKDTTPNAICTGSPHSIEASGNQGIRSRLGNSSQLHSLPATFGGSGFERMRCCGTHKSSPSHSFESTSRRKTGDFKDGALKRVPPVGFTNHALAQPHHQEVQCKTGARLPLPPGLSHLEKTLGECSSTHQPAEKPFNSVPTEAQRSVARSPTQPSKCLGSQDARSVGGRLLSSSVREPRKAAPTISAAASGNSTAGLGGNPKVREAGPQVRTPLKYVFPQTYWVVEFFSGCANLSKACMNEGFHTMSFDILYGPGNDVLCPTVLDKAIKFLQTHCISLVWFGTPCTTWSRAREWDGGPPPLRDDHDGLLGRDGLSKHDQTKVDLGNQLLNVTLKIISICNQLGLRWVLENPWTSRLWLVPAVQQLPGAVLLKTDYCQFRMPWRKATGLMHSRFSELSSAVKTCKPVNNRCSATNRPHIILQGKDEHGVFFTFRAQPYPVALCRQIALALSSSVSKAG